MLSKIGRKVMTEAAILEKIETLNQAVARLQERVEELEDLRDLEAAIAENAGKPLIPWEKVKTELVLPGGSKSLIAGQIDRALTRRGWQEKQFATAIPGKEKSKKSLARELVL